MATSDTDARPSTSYEFFDQRECVLLRIFANGNIPAKDVDVAIETDSLEVRTPTPQSWTFQLFEHIYPDLSVIKTEVDSTGTRTIIELCLHKQRALTLWPHVHSPSSTPKTSEQHTTNPEAMDPTNDTSTTTPVSSVHDLSLKRIPTDFEETNSTVILKILIPKVYDCQAKFTETNFTVTFQTNDEQFLRDHSILVKRPLSLLIRVRERIKSVHCGERWTRIQPDEYSELRPAAKTPSSTTLPLSANDFFTPYKKVAQSTFFNYPPLSTDSKSTAYKSNALDLGYKNDLTFLPSSKPTIGHIGIYNPANSCFMNAALQCLANTRELRDYFLESCHQLELNRTNPLGMKGEIAEKFADLIQGLWSINHPYVYVDKLRSLIGSYHREFAGTGQHDAQELLTVLLDGMHEDLNRILNKPQVPSIENQNRPDDIVAHDYWHNYLRRNDSIVVQLFTGQFKSITKCTQCRKESLSFDPFTSLSVPVSKRTAVDVIVMYRTDGKPSIKYRILMTADGSVKELKSLLANKCGLPVSKMLAYRIRYGSKIEFLKNEDRVPTNGFTLNNTDMIYVTETLSSSECNNEPIVQLTFTQRVFKVNKYVSSCAYCRMEPNLGSSPKFCTRCYQVSYCDEGCEKFHATDHRVHCQAGSSHNYETIGLPFVISLPESQLTCKHVFAQIRIHAKRHVDVHIERSKTSPSTMVFNDHADDEEDSYSDIEDVDWLTIKRTLSSSDSWSICRLGDYFVKTSQNKRRRHSPNAQGAKSLESRSNSHEHATATDDDSSCSSTEDFDMLDDIYGRSPLFRIMPQSSGTTDECAESIVEADVHGDGILQHHRVFSIDWFTDNHIDAPLRITPSKHSSAINDLVVDESVSSLSSLDQHMTLAQCLQMFIEPEVLSSEDKWDCPHCREPIQAEKRISIWRLPPILIIHLKRFKYNHCSSSSFLSDSREKIDTTVKFPIHDLDMAPYCSSLPETNPSSNDAPRARYDLFGIVNHRGTAGFGHYTSNARLLGHNDSAKTELGWRHFDDQRVKDVVCDKDLIGSEAYILFYRHRQLPVNLAPLLCE